MYTLEEEVTITAKYPWTCGSFGEVWYGIWGSKKVAVKVIKITSFTGLEKFKKVWAVPGDFLVISYVRLTSVQQKYVPGAGWGG